jgi:predicted nuclease of predicted toxin-antitoxin system
VKLLFDENLSPKLVRVLADAFPDSAHVDPLGLRGATDVALWNLARDGGFAIVSKDNDFRQRVFLDGTPPKVIWLSVGNAGTDVIAGLLLENQERLTRFLADEEEGLLVLQA